LMRAVIEIFAGALFFGLAVFVAAGTPRNSTNSFHISDPDAWRIPFALIFGTVGFIVVGRGYKRLRAAGRIERALASFVALLILSAAFAILVVAAALALNPWLAFGSAAMTVFCLVLAGMVFRKFWRGD
jgi:O-antigen/teichoic acid export membrane protein